MKKSLFIPVLLLVVYSCSPDEETQAPTNTVQTTIPEPETLVVQYTLTVTAGEGGNVTDGGTFDDGTEISITATPNEGYEFVGWEGNDSSDSDLKITLNSNQTVQPIFQTVQPISQNEEYNYEYNQLDINEPPFYDGTIFASGDIITSADPSLLSEIEYKGTGQREMYDRRNGGAWINIEPFEFLRCTKNL